MISSVTGKVSRIADGQVELQTAGGLGYQLGVPTSLLPELALAADREVTLLTHLVVRADDMELFGFQGVAQRDLFRRLIALSGVGPRSALALLSAFSADEFFSCVTAGDEKGLSQAQGIGAKTARRIIAELRDAAPSADAEVSSARAEARRALEGLAFSAVEAADLVRRAVGEGTKDNADSLVHKALQLAGARRPTG